MKKNSKKKKNNKLKLILLCLFVIIIVLVIVNLAHKKKEPKEIPDTERNTPYTRPDTVSLIGQDDFFKQYEGNVSYYTIMDKITEFVYYIIDNKLDIDEMTEEELMKEYETNETEFKNIGIQSSEDYKQMMLVVQKLGIGEVEFAYAEIPEETVKQGDEYTTGELVIKFVEKDELRFKIQIANDKTNQQPVTYKKLDN